MENHEIEAEHKHITELLAMASVETEIIYTKIRDGSLYMILDEKSLKSESRIREQLEKETKTLYRLVPLAHRFPEKGMSSPPKMKTLAIVRTIFPKLPPMGTGPMVVIHIIAIFIALIIQQGYELVTQEDYQFGSFSEECRIILLVLSILSVVHILLRIIARDVKKIKTDKNAKKGVGQE